MTQAILDEIDKNSQLMANIEYLCDMIGPRLTGSAGLTRANQWTRDKFSQYGLANSHLEPWTIHRAWTRGEAKGRVVAPTEQRLLLESAGWSPSTKGPVRRAGRSPQGRIRRGALTLQRQAQGSLGLAAGGFGSALAQAAQSRIALCGHDAADAGFRKDDAVQRGAQGVPGRRGGRGAPA